MDALLAARSQEKLTPTAAEHVKFVAKAKKASDTQMALQQKAMLKAEAADKAKDNAADKAKDKAAVKAKDKALAATRRKLAALERRAKSDKSLEPQVERLRQEVTDIERAQNMTQEQATTMMTQGGGNNARGMATKGPCCHSALSFAAPRDRDFPYKQE